MSMVIIVKSRKPRELNSEVIKKAIQSEGFTAKRLSEITGITEGELKEHLKAKSIPRGLVLLRIGKALKLGIDDILVEK